MTDLNLTAIEIAKLTAVLTGGGFKRSATKDAAAARFLKVAEETGAFAHEAALNTLSMDFEAANRVVTAIKAGIEQAALPSESKSRPSPGLARLRASESAGELRETSLDDAAKAREAVLSGKPTARKAALALGVEPAPTTAAKPAKAQKAEKPATEGAVSRSRLNPEAKIVEVVANPKKAGSRSHKRFELYKAGQTIKAFVEACVAAGFPASEANADISWDRRKGFIRIEEVAAA